MKQKQQQQQQIKMIKTEHTQTTQHKYNVRSHKEADTVKSDKRNKKFFFFFPSLAVCAASPSETNTLVD